MTTEPARPGDPRSARLARTRSGAHDPPAHGGGPAAFGAQTDDDIRSARARGRPGRSRSSPRRRRRAQIRSARARGRRNSRPWASNRLRASFGQRGAAVFWTAALALGVAGTQMASFSKEYVHIDEHLYIVLSAHVLDGGLPNVGIFDNKPPLFFYLQAGAFALLGETLSVARLFGDLSIFVMSVATFGIARRWTGPLEAGLGALLVVASTAGTLGQATLTDFPAMALLMSGVWALFAGRRRPWLAGCAGFLASAAVLVRLNLGISALAMGAWLAFCACRRSPGPGPSGRPGAPRAGSSLSPRPAGWAPLVAFSAAALALPSLFVFLYWRADALSELRFFTFDVPLSYSAQGNVSDAIGALVTWVPRALLRHHPLLTAVFAVCMATGCVAALQRLRRRPAAPPDKDDELLLAVMVAAFWIALLTAGVVNDHYVYWGVPLGAVYAARGIARATAPVDRLPAPWSARARRMVSASAFVAVAGLLASALHERATQPRLVQPVRLAAEAIAADRQPGDGVWPLDQPIASWYLDMESPVPMIFPWNLAKPAMLRPIVESGRLPARPLRAAMATSPTYLLARSADGGFRPPEFMVDYDAGEAARLAQWVQDNYALFYDAHGIAVYKAKDRS